MKEKILQILSELRSYALGKKYDISLYYHEEDSYLMRFANSAISLNTNEHLIRLEITAHDDKKRASYEMITDLSKLEEMKQAIDNAAEMVKHVMPLTYQPTIPTYSKPYIDESAYDSTLASISNEEKLAYFNQVSAGLETEEIKLSGIFSCGANTIATINTRSEHPIYVKTSDAQITTVLAHGTLKWEITAEQSAQQKSDLKPDALHAELVFLLNHYQHDTPQQIPLGKYDIVFGTAATADMLNFMNYIAHNGGLMKRGYSFLKEENIGQKVFSDQFTLMDDPTRPETFPFGYDLFGMERKPFSIMEDGVFKSFTWMQDDADEFDTQPTGHTVPHISLVMLGGSCTVNSLKELVSQPRERDILYIPFLHYMNIVNPSKGIITASSRFGALLLKKDGSVVIPYNVRITQSLLDIFGNQVAWLSNETAAYNTSQSYGARNPSSIIVPKFMQVNDLEISHSNSSY
jgi:predicted Zn-dependent protease